jgi:hypothetical protein
MGIQGSIPGGVIMRVLVCGGRDFNDFGRLCTVLDGLSSRVGPIEICHGGARGADALAGCWASDRTIDCTVYAADWLKHGKAAGCIRNATMLAEFKPDLVVAFPGGRGTTDMVRRAKRAGVDVVDLAPS